MSGSFPSFSINDGDWVRVRQFVQRVSTYDLQGGGQLVPYSGAVSNVDLGSHTLTTTGIVATGNLTVSSTLLLASGSITDSTGTISFGNENISTTGTLASGTHTIGTLALASGNITDSTGAIAFGNENLSTTGSMTGASFVSGTLTLTGASITDSTGAISFGNENLLTAGNVTGASFISGTLTLTGASIVDSTGAISFGNENLSTTGTLASGTHTIGTLTLAAASITDSTGTIAFGNENLNTSGTLTLGVVGTTPYPLFIKAISGVSYTIYLKDSNNYLRGRTEATGAQGWYLNTGAVESGSISYATPGGTNTTILLNAYDHTTGTTFYYRNNFYIAHCDTIFRMGFSADNFAMLAFHKGSKLQVNYGNYDFDFQVSGDTNTNLFYCDASTDRIGIGTATPAVTFDVLGTSRFGDSATNYAQFATDGELTLAGTAKVKKRILIPLAAIKTGAIDPPSEGTVDGFRTLDFDGGTKDEEVFKPFCGPLDWSAGTGATLNLRFFVDTAPAAPANVVWQIEIKSIACDGIVDFSSGTSTYIDTVAITTGTPANDKKLHCSELTIPTGNLIAGGCLFIRLHRDATHASDTFTGDARLLKVFITYTADKLGEAT